MIKALRMMLLATLAVFVSTFANAQETKTAKWLASSGDALQTIYVGNDLSLKWEEGGGDQAPKYSGSYVYFYNGNRLNVAGTATDVLIQKVVFKFKDNEEKLGMATCDKSGKNVSNADMTTDKDAFTTTWEGTATNSLYFRANQGTGYRYIESIEVTYTGEAPVVEKVPELAITQDGIADTYDMDQNGVFVVYYANNGKAAAENVKLNLYVDGTVNATKTIGTLAIGASSFWNAVYDVTNLAAGEHQVYLEMTADNAETVKTGVKTVTFTKKAPEAAFTVTAQNVTVAYDAAEYQVVALVKNTSEVAAEGVEVMLQRNVQNVVDPQTVDLAAGEEKQVTFTVAAPEGGFAAGVTTYWVVVKAYEKTMAQQEVTVTVEEAPVVDQIDMAITAVQGAAEIDLNGTNVYKVWYKNEGNVTVENADIILLVNDNEAGLQTVTVEPGQQGFCEFTLDVANLFEESEDLGMDAAIVGFVNVEGDVNAENNRSSMTAKVVKNVAEPTFVVSAQDVEVEFGAEKFDVVATVTADQDVDNAEVKLFYNSVIATQTVSLKAGEAATVTFADVENPFKTAGEYTMQVIAGKAVAEVKVTVKPEPVADVVDMAIEAIQGGSEIKLNAENKFQVWYKNNGNVKMEDVVIMFSVNDHAQEQAVTVEAGKNGYVEFTVPTDIFEPGEDTEAELIAWVNVEGDADNSNDRVAKTVAIVSGEVEPTAEIMINPIRGWEVEAGEQEISVSVSVFNQSETVDAKDVKIELYHNYGDGLCEPQTVDIKAGGYKMLTFKFNYTFVAGKDVEFTVFTGYKDGNADDNMRSFTMTCPAPQATVAMAKINDIEATTEEAVKIAATVTNTSDVDAQEVKVGVYTVNDSYQYELVGILQTADIAAGESADFEFNLGQLAEGTYTYYVRVASVAGVASTVQRDVTVKVTAPVADVIDMAITAVQGKSEIDLAGENIYKVWYKNEGNVTVENADVILLVNDNEAGRQTVTVAPGEQGVAEFTLDVDNLFDPIEDLGLEATIMGFVNVEGDENADNNRSTMTATVVKSAAEATFEVVAEAVTVAYDATSFEIKAVVKNTSEVAAEQVEVKLFHNSVIATTTIEALAAGAEQEVTFTVEATEEAPFAWGKTETYYVQAGKAQADVEVTFEAAPVEEKIDMAITAIQGLSQIDLTQENKVQVWYENKGNVDLEGVAIMLSVNDNPVGPTQTVDVKAGKSGYVEYTIDVADFEPGEDIEAELAAWVNVEGDADATNDKVTRTVPVINGETPVATFEVVAEAVTVAYGAESFEIKAVVKNTSEVAAEQVEVKLFHNSVIATTTIEALAAGAEQEVTFTVEATEEAPFGWGKTETYYVQAPLTQAAVEVTFEAAPVEEKIDMAITAIQGITEIDLTAEDVTAQVWYENLSNVDLENVAIMFSVNDHALEQNVSVAAGRNGYVTFAIDKAWFEVGEDAGSEAELVAWVNVEGDQNADNNKVTKLVPVVNGVADLSFEVAEVVATKGATSFDVTVTVKNNGNAAAENVDVKVFSVEPTAELGAETIEKIVAGGEVSVRISVEKTYGEVGLYKNQLQVAVTGLEPVYVDVNVIETAVGIAAVKAQFGENVQIFTLSGKKVENVRRGQVYIVNGKKIAVK